MAKQTKKQSAANASALLNHVTAEQLSLEGAEKKVSAKGFALCVKALLQNWRQGTVAVKGRSDVSFSNKKPWKQKGTGRARAGSARSPIWRGGGIVFGPQPRTRTLSVTKQTKRNVMNGLLFQFLNAERISALNWTAPDERPRTANAYTALKNAGLVNENIVLFVPSNDTLTYASFANIPSVRVLFFDQPNVFDLAKGERWVFLSKDFDHFKAMVSQWI